MTDAELRMLRFGLKLLNPPITRADLWWENAAMMHHEAGKVGLCPQIPFTECDEKRCIVAREAFSA